MPESVSAGSQHGSEQQWAEGEEATSVAVAFLHHCGAKVFRALSGENAGILCPELLDTFFEMFSPK